MLTVTIMGTVVSLYSPKVTTLHVCNEPLDCMEHDLGLVDHHSWLRGSLEARKWNKHQMERTRLSSQLEVTWQSFFGHLFLFHIFLMNLTRPEEVLSAWALHTIQYILNWPLPIGAFQGQWNNQRNNRTQQQQQLLRIPAGRRQTSWLYTSEAGKLNQGLPGTNSASGQSGSWTRDLRISRQAP